MAYEKTNWVTGDIITAEKLNHVEQGVEDASQGGGVFNVLYTVASASDTTCDKTYNEILAAFKSGQTINCFLVSYGVYTGFIIGSAFEEMGKIVFVSPPVVSSNGVTQNIITHKSDDTVEMQTEQYKA